MASKFSDFAGDGTTTATVLAQAIVKEGAKTVAAGMNPMDLKRGIDLVVELLVAGTGSKAHSLAPTMAPPGAGAIHHASGEVGIDSAEAVEARLRA